MAKKKREKETVEGAGAGPDDDEEDEEDGEEAKVEGFSANRSRVTQVKGKQCGQTAPG